MKFGTNLSFPGMGAAPSALREFAQGLDGAGFDFLGLGGHLLSAAPDRFAGRPNPTYVGPFREPFVTFSYLAALTQRLHFMTGILILPEMPTALVAKQASELSIISGGRFELGIGISWNEVEYATMGQPFRNRARRMVEQVTLLRQFWTQRYVHFEGRYHQVDGMSLGELPAAPVPIWWGSGMLDKVAELGDGWFPIGDQINRAPELKQALTAAGRDASTFGIMGRLTATDDGPEAWVAEGRRLQSLGATHISIGAPPSVEALPPTLSRITEAKNALEAGL